MMDIVSFMTHAKRYPILPKYRQLELAKAYAGGDKRAGQMLVNSNLRYVVSRARAHLKYCTAHITLPDLIQEGCVGLLRAVEKFNPSFGYNLITYARSWIDAHIRNYIVNNFYSTKYGTTHAGRVLFFKHKVIMQIIDMEAEEDKELARKELANHINRNNKKARINTKMIKAHEGRVVARELSIDKSYGDWSLSDIITDDSPDAISCISRSRIKGILEQAILESGLTLKEIKVIKDRFLLENPKTLAAVGSDLNISRQRVEQIQQDALNKLKAGLKRRGITQELV